MGRSGRSVPLHALAAVAVIAAGTAVVLTRGTPSIAGADTLVGAARDAQIVSAAGVTRPARAGDRIADGEVVTTGPGGRAELLTSGRVVMMAAAAAIEVVDGAHQQLRTGTVVVDAQQGAGLMVDVAGDSVAVPHGSATEARRGVSVRIGALAGAATITNAGGRRLTLAPLSQAIVNGVALPGATTPLHLTDSDDEARAVPVLVSDDLAMQTLARGIDTTGQSTAHAVDASWHGSIAPMTTRGDRSERVLPVVIADATTSAGGSAQERYDRVVAWRAAGGSWGVVVHLLSSRAAAVAAALAALQLPQPSGHVGKPLPHRVQPTRVAAAPSGDLSRGVRSGHSTQHHPTKPPATAPPAPGRGLPLPLPTPPGLVGGVVTTVQTVVGGLVGVLPLKHRGAAKPAQPDPPAVSPRPTAAATTLLGGLVGGLLGG